VWITKYRLKILKEYVKNEMLKDLFKLMREFKDWDMVEVNIQVDHVHMIISFPPDISISEVVKLIKGRLSNMMNKRFKFLRKIYKERGLWSRGYYVSTIGLDEKRIRDYVKFQEEEDKGQIEIKLF
jgi:putative transposase